MSPAVLALDGATEARTGAWRPRIVRDQPQADEAAATTAAAALLRALGLDLTDRNLVETPKRMAKALIELTSSPEFEMTTFPNDEGYDELVLVRDIPVQSICEHHMLPFTGVAHVAYLPGDRIVGLSKLARMVAHHARRPQTQERLTKQIAEHLDQVLHPRGVGVVIEAAHTCMSLRGARAHGTLTKTSAMLGLLREDPRTRAEFLSLVQ